MHLAERGESFRILEGHPFRALEIHEVTERPLPERHQRDLNIRRVPAGQDGEVRPLEMRRRADRRQDVRGQGQVQHLLLDDVDEGGFPRLDPRQLLRGYALRDAPFQGKLGVEVFAEEAVFQLTGLTQQVDELLPALDAKGRLRRLPVRRPSRRHRSHCRPASGSLEGARIRVVFGAVWLKTRRLRSTSIRPCFGSPRLPLSRPPPSTSAAASSGGPTSTSPASL